MWTRKQIGIWSKLIFINFKKVHEHINLTRSTKLRTLAFSLIFFPLHQIWLCLTLLFSQLFHQKSRLDIYFDIVDFFFILYFFSFGVCILSSIRISSCGLTMFENNKLDFPLFQFLKTSACPACEACNSLTCVIF